ncbi:SemiSWEET transporter [Parvibium lacunae]|uniref:Glutathione synthetase n=1 Tax=Parvibium lacunae TaxID=1888893 RepID=A0A368L3W5_9BURK|nr:SemiSWEET transporter [Parvibium lacunae]RCS58112.1 hypothetical protein DU000_04535 [Parvibium lacunae]
MLSPSDILGYAAATLTTLAFFPQAWHCWKNRDVTSISLPMYFVFSLGVALWLLYGVCLQSWPIIIANSITLVLACLILFMKIRFSSQHDASRDNAA